MDNSWTSTFKKLTRESSLYWNRSSNLSKKLPGFPSSRMSTTDIASQSLLDWDQRCTVLLMRSTSYTTQQREFLATSWSMERGWVWRTSSCTNASLRQRRRKMQWSKAPSSESTTRPSISARRSKPRHLWLARTTRDGSWTTMCIHWHSGIIDCWTCKGGYVSRRKRSFLPCDGERSCFYFGQQDLTPSRHLRQIAQNKNFMKDEGVINDRKKAKK